MNLQIVSEVRKKWFLSFRVLMGVNALICAANLVLDMGEGTVVSGLGLLGLAIWGWTTYHCAYRKRGTAWLNFVIYSTLAGMFKTIVVDLKYILPLGLLEFSTVFLVIHSCLIVLSIWFLVHCWQYRQENLALKKSKSEQRQKNLKNVPEI